jgi:hypothetical protein
MIIFFHGESKTNALIGHNAMIMVLCAGAGVVHGTMDSRGGAETQRILKAAGNLVYLNYDHGCVRRS